MTAPNKTQYRIENQSYDNDTYIDNASFLTDTAQEDIKKSIWKKKKKVNKFCRNLKILSSPAFRNQYLFNSANYKKIKKKYKKKIILIVLSGIDKEQKSIFYVLNKIINNFSNFICSW